jgi:hypothetical protein
LHELSVQANAFHITFTTENESSLGLQGSSLQAGKFKLGNILEQTEKLEKEQTENREKE